MDTSFAKKIFYLIDNYSGLFVKHSPDWKYIAVSDDNLRKIFGFQSPRNIQEFDKLIDVVFPDELSVKLRGFICRSPSALRSQSPNLLRKRERGGVRGGEGGKTPTD